MLCQLFSIIFCTQYTFVVLILNKRPLYKIFVLLQFVDNKYSLLIHLSVQFLNRDNKKLRVAFQEAEGLLYQSIGNERVPPE